jgi:hypothetical protein
MVYVANIEKVENPREFIEAYSRHCAEVGKRNESNKLEQRLDSFFGSLQNEFEMRNQAKELQKQLSAALKLYRPEERGLRAYISGLLEAQSGIACSWFVERAKNVLRLHQELHSHRMRVKEERKKADAWIQNESKEYMKNISPKSGFFLKAAIQAYENWKAEQDGRSDDIQVHILLGYSEYLSSTDLLCLLEKLEKQNLPRQMKLAS